MRADGGHTEAVGAQLGLVIGANLFVLLLIGMCKAAYAALY
ncbi:hypothetical protein [uncultured Sphingomonas sp.]